ncbi:MULTISPECIES: hypothetical protein [unclassified Peribacillus]|uniref:hypothetical protein n=1 Tax=unclassified Peribacillus TaxID=2675266 RepID=UPI00191168CE|nr:MULTISPECIES: hypothetical protein [unclassified Peribacillus]MBK5462578.1 hypothetical protein [Peribacillus sp. TH27]WMX54252.1 hypothetical protein RE409_19535 [Peribacillus sp. R9-11]
MNNSKGGVFAKLTVKGKGVTSSIKQLGKKSGKVYVTVTKSGQKESARVLIYEGKIIM